MVVVKENDASSLASYVSFLTCLDWCQHKGVDTHCSCKSGHGWNSCHLIPMLVTNYS